MQAQDYVGWKKQLEGIRQNEILKDKGYPQLISYAYQEEIKTVDEVKLLKEKLLSYTDNYLPIVNENNKVTELLNLEGIETKIGKENIAARIKSLSDYFDSVIQPGVHTVKLTWEFHSKKYESLCVVSDNGVVYDHIIMNLMITP